MTSDIKTYTPKLGLIVFDCKESHQHYVQVHDITTNGWGEGKPLRKEDLIALADSIKTQQFTSLKMEGLIPENVLFFEPNIAGNKFMWFLLPHKATITFEKSVKIPSGEYHVPGLIMAVKNKDLYIYAYKGKMRPNEKTKLYHAPFYNTYDSGEFCMGTITETRAKAFLHEEMDRWQRRFFGGVFTTAHDEKDRIADGWTFKKSYAAMKKAFPEESLLQANHKTIKDLLRQF